MEESLVVGMVGDLLVDRENPLEAFANVRNLLDAPEILFGNHEAVYTDRPHRAPCVDIPLFPQAYNLDVFSKVGFDVLSMANNHIVDAGHAAMLENRDRLRQQGIKTCGAGASLADAREPAVLERAGIRVAFLAYASVFPTGYEARSEVPGLVPLRAYDFWRPAIDNYQIPGMRPRVHSVTDERDLAGLEEDIRQAKKRADLVVTSFHWGDAMRPHHLTEHERRTAHFCIDRGADMVVGHHHHAVRGIEWYAGRPILYGLGHFVFDFRMAFSEEAKAALTETPENVAALGDDYGMYPREGWPLLPMHPDMRMTLFAYAKATKECFTEIGFVPCRLQPDGRVVAFNADSEEGRQVVRYVSRGIASQRLNARIESEGAPSIGGYRSVRCVDAGADVAASRVAR